VRDRTARQEYPVNPNRPVFCRGHADRVVGPVLRLVKRAAPAAVLPFEAVEHGGTAERARLKAGHRIVGVGRRQVTKRDDPPAHAVAARANRHDHAGAHRPILAGDVRSQGRCRRRRRLHCEQSEDRQPPVVGHGRLLLRERDAHIPPAHRDELMAQQH